MRRSHRLIISLATIAGVLAFSGCSSNSPVSPTTPSASGTPRIDVDTPPDQVDATERARVAILPECDSLQVPVEARLAYHAFASGVQTYRWSGSAWTFVAPTANLYADAAQTALIG